MPDVILVSSEHSVLALELLGQARRLAEEIDAKVGLCVSGAVGPTDLDSYAAHGADLVYTSGGVVLDACQWADLVSSAIAESQAGLVLIGATKTGMEVAARVAERTGASYAAWAVKIQIDAGFAATTASCQLYAGTGLATYRFSRALTVLSVAQGVFETDDQPGRTARVESLVLKEQSSRLTVIGERAKSSSGTRLQGARAIIDVGRGVKDHEDLDMVRALASLLDGQVSCSRPV